MLGGNMESIREMVERRAYELFMARGGLHGYHIQDWVQAEKEVLAEQGDKVAIPVPKSKSEEKPKETSTVAAISTPSTPTKVAPTPEPTTTQTTSSEPAPAKKKAPLKKKA